MVKSAPPWCNLYHTFGTPNILIAKDGEHDVLITAFRKKKQTIAEEVQWNLFTNTSAPQNEITHAHSHVFTDTLA